MEKILTVDEVAEKLKVTPFMVRDLLRSGKLKGFKVGKLWRIEESELDGFVEFLKSQNKERKEGR